jgi:hypothetical protein
MVGRPRLYLRRCDRAQAYKGRTHLVAAMIVAVLAQLQPMIGAYRTWAPRLVSLRREKQLRCCRLCVVRLDPRGVHGPLAQHSHVSRRATTVFWCALPE